jgi:hypothetical protein
MRANPFRPIASTVSERIAAAVVDRLCKPVPKGWTWREYAEREIALAIHAASMRIRSEP